MKELDLQVKYEYSQNLPLEEAEARLARAFGVIFDEIEKNGDKLNEQKNLQTSTK